MLWYSGGDEIAYIEEVDLLVSWCSESNLPTAKDKEHRFDFRIQKIEAVPLTISSSFIVFEILAALCSWEFKSLKTSYTWTTYTYILPHQASPATPTLSQEIENV